MTYQLKEYERQGIDLDSEHTVVPADHAPAKKDHYVPEALKEMTVCEVENKDAWISMDNEDTMEVKQ